MEISKTNVVMFISFLVVALLLMAWFFGKENVVSDYPDEVDKRPSVETAELIEKLKNSLPEDERDKILLLMSSDVDNAFVVLFEELRKSISQSNNQVSSRLFASVVSLSVRFPDKGRQLSQKFFRQCSTDEDKKVRVWAVSNILISPDSPDADFKTLVHALGDLDEDVSNSAIDALVGVGVQGKSRLENLLRSENVDANRKEALVKVLEKIDKLSEFVPSQSSGGYR